jgi:hypothetical protein
VIARLKPSELLKSVKNSASWTQQGLVVAQFAISATLPLPFC